MRVEHRAGKDAAAFEPGSQIWIPYTLHGPEGGRRLAVEVQPGDEYATVDDVADGEVVFDVSPWPRLDADGRLVFDGEPRELVASLAETQAFVDAARRAEGVTGAARPLRVGDAFLVRDLAAGAASLDGATLFDVSAAARDAAKAALYGAAASTVEDAYASRVAITAAYEEAVPDAGRFDVRQSRRPPPGPDRPEAAR